MRLDKFLANAGVGTRKEVREILKKRKVLVNGNFEKDGSTQINEDTDEILMDGEKLSYNEFIYLMLNKPDGVISATEDARHKTVIDLLDEKYKKYQPFPVGRLDQDTEGLLILTNDGILAHNLLSPKKHVDKTYYVELNRKLTPGAIEKIENGLQLADNFITKDAKVKLYEEDRKKCFITITEGKYHQVKRMFGAVNNKVLYLKRVQMGNLKLDESIPLGEYRELTTDELELLKSVNWYFGYSFSDIIVVKYSIEFIKA